MGESGLSFHDPSTTPFPPKSPHFSKVIVPVLREVDDNDDKFRTGHVEACLAYL